MGAIHPGTTNPFFGEYSDVVYVAAGPDTALLMASSAGDAAVERSLIDSLARRNVDGIIVMTSMTRADVAALHDPGIPLLFVNCPFPVPGYRSIGPDALDGSRRIVDHLLDVHGHSSVALVAGETGETGPEDRERGWRRRCAPIGSATRPRSGPASPSTADTTPLVSCCAVPTRRQRSSPLPTSSPTAHSTRSTTTACESPKRSRWSASTEPQGRHTLAAGLCRPAAPRAMADTALSSILGGSPPAHTVIDTNLIIRQSCGCAPLPPPGHS